MNTEQKLLDLFEKKGIFLSESEKDDELELDSIQFISMIIDIEETFSIRIDENDMLFEKFNTFNNYLRNIEFYLSQK